MSNNLIDKRDPRVADLLQRLEKVGKTLDELKIIARPCLKGKRFITDKELSAVLKISRRTLQEYRSSGIIPYYLICGKVIYDETEIQRFLDDCRKRSPAERDLL